ncbi:MAG: hypothetical protein AB8B95_11465 [Pseudohongiellaceae bacterium]
MNWEAIGAIGEILGAMAVVLTLVYLAVQVRYAKDAASDNNRIARASGVREMMLATATHPELRELGLKTYDIDYFQELAKTFDLTLDQAYTLDQQNGYWFWLHWGQFASTTKQNDIDELKNLIQNFYRMPAVMYCWKNSPFHRFLLDPKFVEFVDGLLADAD